jgi:hypothetical protein
MSGGADSIQEPPSTTGRHRRGGAGAWTPTVPPPSRRDHSRHEIYDPPVRGALPLPAATAAAAVSGGPGFPASNGELPVQRVPARPEPARLPRREMALPQRQAVVLPPAAEPVSPAPAIRRTKVTLTPAAPSRFDDDTRIHLAAPVDGLGTFDLGSVPASVTPPKTWRKAAWFAAVSSGGVVVSLLFAGTLLVGKPDIDQATQGWPPGYQGGSPLISGEQDAGVATGGTSSARKPSDGSRSTEPTTPPSDAHTRNDGGMNPPAAPPQTTAGPSTTGTAAPPANPVPPKPPYTPPSRETTPPPWYSQPQNPKTMGDNTETFFNSVPTDPAAASAVTTGELHDQGPQALKQRYADVAYFQVKNISIDQNRDVTVSTVQITHKDGTQTVEQQTLTFSDDGKIESDGR